MNTIQHWKTIIDHWAEFEPYPSIYSFILYSPLDKNMIKFFSNSECWGYLDGMSTNRCLNFIIAETRPGFPNWNDSIEENYEPPEFYETADAFGIKEDKIPCLIFFRDIESRLEERIVYSIDRNANPKELRGIFDKIYTKIERQDHINDKEKREEQKEKIFSKFKRASWGKRVVKWVKQTGRWVGQETIKSFISEIFDRLGIKKAEKSLYL